MEGHATMGAMERAKGTLEVILRTTKLATETTDHPLISSMARHCCWIFCPYHVRAEE